MAIFLTADTHHNHNNILTMENRPFETIEEMSKSLIKTWNSQVGTEDKVIFDGDFAFSDSFNKVAGLFEQLNGEITVIGGNHDKPKVFNRLYEQGLIHAYYEVGIKMEVDKHHMWVTHYPMQIGLRPRLWSIHGHIHSLPSDELNQLNVGVDSPLLKHKPFGELVSLDELVNIMNSRTEEIEELFLQKRK